MLALHDVEVITGSEEADEISYYTSIQRAINAGSWSFEGSFGRSMMAAIEDGRCFLGTKPARDYYGNRIPSRSEVQEGTKGSVQFVANRMGQDWAETMEGV